jgi:hypothetical protein
MGRETEGEVKARGQGTKDPIEMTFNQYASEFESITSKPRTSP